MEEDLKQRVKSHHDKNKGETLDLIMVLTRRTFPRAALIDEAALKRALINNEVYLLPGNPIIEGIRALVLVDAGYCELEELIELEKHYRKTHDTHKGGPEQVLTNTVRELYSQSPRMPEDIILAFAMDNAREAKETA